MILFVLTETSLNSFMIIRKCYEELGKRCVVKTESQKVSKNILGYLLFLQKVLLNIRYIKREELIVKEWLILLISL